ncbi:MAG: diguanylate cyclase [Candidatus Omnitrophica bacterium]|nr:diguanylate cyclase [Candidatus Omnitrophota bacterium]
MQNRPKDSVPQEIKPVEESKPLVAVGVIDKDENIVCLDYLSQNGFLIENYPSSQGLQEHIIANIPHILLLDMDVLDRDAIIITKNLKENPLTYTKPVIILIGQRNIDKEIQALEAGAEDFVEKPFPKELLAARIQTTIRRNIRLQISNPLTGLPGALYIEEQTSKRIQNKETIAMCYVDLNDFKAFNDKYGYLRGDNVIRILATILNEAISMHGAKGDLVGHIGGDDFVMILNCEEIAPVCDYVTKSFDALIPYQYDEHDRNRGCIASKNRQGEDMLFPIMTVSIGIVTNQNREISNYLMMTELAAEMKEYAKQLSKSSPLPKSLYRIDKRTND